MYLEFGCKLTRLFFFFEHFPDHLSLEFCSILLSFLFLRISCYILQTNLFLSKILRALYYHKALWI